MIHPSSSADVVQLPSGNAVPTGFVKGFAGVYGTLDANCLMNPPKKIDLHFVSARDTTNNRLYLIGASTQPVSFSWPMPAEQVVVKGRPFWTAEQPERWRDSDSFDSAVLHLDGKFSLCVATAKGLRLATDLIGAGPIYYAPRGQRVFYATHLGILLWLLNETPESNLVGAVSILISRAQIERETHFRDIFRLGAGERLIATRRGDNLALDVGPYANVAEVLSRDTYGMPADPNVFGELLRASIVREKYPAGTALMLSGGRDSKAIALAKPDRDFTAITYGTADSRDVRHARLRAAALGVEHRRVPYDKWTHGTFARQIIGLSAGASGLADAHNMVGYAWARPMFSLAIVGYLGGPVTGWAIHSDEAATVRRRRSLLFPNLNARDFDFRSNFPDEVNYLIEAERKQEAALSGLSTVQVSMVQDWTIRQASWLSLMFDLCEWYCDLSYPFYYRPLLQFMFNRSFSELSNQSLYDAWSTAAAARSGLQGLGRRQKMDDVRAITLSLLLKRRLPRPRISWPAVTDRSRLWLEQTLAQGSGHFRELSKRSYEATLRLKAEGVMPTFLLSIPLTLATEPNWRAETMVLP